MSVTGFELGRRLANKTAQPYTTFTDPVKTNRIFSDALLWAIKHEYKRLPQEKEYAAEIGSVLVTGKSISVNNNQFYLAPLQITNIVFAGAFTTITTFLPHNVNQGDTITIAGVPNINPNINGNYTVNSLIDANTFVIPFTYISGTYTPDSGTVTTPRMYPDYWDILTVKATFPSIQYNVSVTGASNTTPIVVTIGNRWNFRNGEQLTIAGINGNTNANGTYYVKTKGGYGLYLYQDKNFQTPVVGNGNYTSGGVITRTYSNYCKPYESDTKISSLNTPTIYKPRYEQAQRLMKIYPLDQTCTGVTMDYVIQPPVPIDVTDNITDLTLYFPEVFLWEKVVERAVFFFATPARDTELYKMADANIAKGV